MLFFKKPILTKERVKALNQFRKQAVKALLELQGKAKTQALKEIYAGMIRNVESTPIYFYDRKNLRQTVFKAHGFLFGSVVKGEHVNVIKIFQKGKQRFAIKTNFINMPAQHVFEGEKLTVAGIFTLSHEYAHFPKPALGAFAKANRISFEQAEELLADALSAKLAVSLGYPKELVLENFSGRQLVYGKTPFKKFIWNAVNS